MASRNTPGTSSSYLTKQQKREQAREKARLLQEAEAKRTKRRHLFIAVGSTLTVLLVVAAVAFVILNGMKKEEDAKRVVSPSANVSSSGVISLGKGSEEGIAQAGKKNAGKPTVRIYSDYLCIHCNDLEKEYGNKLVNLASKGEITLEIAPLSVLGQKISDVASQADYYIAEKAPEYYAAFHNAYFADVSAPIFAKQKQLPEQSQYNKTALDVAKKVGIPNNVLKGLEKTLNSNRYEKFLQRSAQKFNEAGHSGTPTITINGKKFEDDWSKGALLEKIEKEAGHSLKPADEKPAVPKKSEAAK